MEAVFEWVSQYGYGAIFLLLVLGIVGLPVPDEPLMVFSGYLISTGRLQPIPTFLAAAAGATCGITLSYVLGRTFGWSIVHRFGRYVHLTPERLERLHQWFHRAGHWSLFFGYYIAGVRHFTAVIAGTSQVEFKIFAAYAWSGALIWVAAFLTLGYFIGEKWKEIAEMVHRFGLYAALLVAAGGLSYYLVRSRRSPKV